GKNLRQQRRGKGNPRYRSPSHNYLGDVSYRNFTPGKVVDIIHAPGRRSPLAVVDSGQQRSLFLATSGMRAGQKITNEFGTGNLVELSQIPEGTKICNIELNPGDGGRLCRASGVFAMLITKDSNKCTLLMPSNKKKSVSSRCRATVGAVASSGRPEKPFMKAGTKHYAMQALGRVYPHTAGVSMNAVDHPFGGQTRPGKPKTVSRHMPPGKKVGNISPRRTGKRKRK
ncbi:MAG: 50S ribosomal protein L2, partial [Candidatus Aenigmarchaeota archaeon]|nr:50S ribosomal protein L2 [Candidatus Aenigmarchaeota archaeon]MDI6722044.1 50S ribosomal protein L2 [Candidatus Aenigmarchaeota archaeon]